MKQIRQHDINYYITKANLYNQNPIERVIGELRRKWYRIMVKRGFHYNSGTMGYAGSQRLVLLPIPLLVH